MDRAIEYAIKTSHAYLSYSYARMTRYTPPKTRKKPTDQAGKEYEVNEYNVNDGITHKDERHKEQGYVYKEECQQEVVSVL